MLQIATGACAQSFSFGMKAGVPMTELLGAASPGHRASTKRYTLGPTVEVSLPLRLAFEADLLYKRVEYGLSTGRDTARASRWEVPLLMKYRFTDGRLGPFLELGGSVNRVTGMGATDDFTVNSGELRHRSTVGFVAGAGLEARLGKMRLALELRFTRWTDRNFGVSDAPLRSNLTQVEFLAGFVF